MDVHNCFVFANVCSLRYLVDLQSQSSSEIFVMEDVMMIKNWRVEI